MKRKVLAISLMLLTMMVGGLRVHAQNVGEWQLYSLFSDGVDKIIDAKNKVYYLSANRVHSFDKNTSESYSYKTDNVLNDIDVTDIYYNAEKNYVLVVYDTSNIDIIDDNDDSVINLSDISIANIAYSKTINDVAFSNSRIYVATAFGLVVYDDESKTVADSGIYGKAVSNVTVSGDYVVANVDGSYMYAAEGSRINTVDKLKKLRAAYSSMIIGTDNGFFEYNTNIKSLRHITVNWANNSSTEKNYSDITTVKSVVRKADKTGAIITDKQVINVDFATGELNTSRAVLPADLQGQVISYHSDLSSIWAGNDDGIANYDISSDTPTVKVDKFKPEALTCSEAAFLVGSEDGTHVYVSNLAYTTYRSVGCVYDDSGAFATRQRTDVFVNGTPKDAAAYNASADGTKSQSLQSQYNNKAIYGIDKLAVDPKDSERYFIPTITDGIYVVKNNEEVGKLNSDNMPIRAWYGGTKGWITCCYFDPEGNLWVGYRNGETDEAKKYSPYLILPAEKVQGDLSAVKASDWIATKHLGELSKIGETRMLICKKSGTIFTFDGEGSAPIGVYQTNGTYSDTSDDKFVKLTYHNTQDAGTTFTPTHWTMAVEDKNGQAWFGSTSGVAVIASPSKISDPTDAVTRPKVPRNDGTNYADYLLDAEQVNAIAVDAANRKWIGTENSGLYYVSENGDEILANYTKDNSPLPSNNIQSLYCDPNSNLVYIGMDEGVITYSSTAVAASADYSDVYAYPNPVRPDFTGLITVTGLMDNSLVKIADAAGNVVFQTRSSGGMAVWDGCNAGGERVKTGVYFVFASQNENDNASAVVTKIMVVK